MSSQSNPFITYIYHIYSVRLIVFLCARICARIFVCLFVSGFYASFVSSLFFNLIFTLSVFSFSVSADAYYLALRPQIR